MAVNRYKVLMVEVNGSDLVDQEELALDASNVYANVSGITSDDVNGALAELYTLASANSSSENFSFRTIAANKFIPTEQQMVVYQEMSVNNGFELTLNGEVVVIV